VVRSSFALLALLTPTLIRGAEKITFDDHVLPIFQQSCLNCHNPDKTKGGLDLSTYSGAMKGGSGGKIAEPGDTASKLIAVVTHAAEPVMPPEGDKLGSAQIDTLRAWIDGGLLETKDSQAKKPTKPRFDSAMSADPAARPEGPPPMPQEPLLEPVVVGERTSAIHAMAASPWAPLLAVTGQRQVLLFRTDGLDLAGILPFPEGDPISLAFTPNGRYLIVGGGIQGKSGFTVTFDVVTGERVLVAGKEFDSILCADLRPDLGEVATGSPSKLVKLWLAADGSQRASIKKHTDWVTRLDYSPDGVLLATGDRNGGVWVWEALSGNEFHTLRAHQAGITAISFRADSNLLASASADGTVRFWEMNNGTEVRKVDAHGPGVMAFAWGPEGRFATAGRDRVAKLWKADFNQERAIEGLADIPTAIAMSQDGQKLFIASYDGAVAVHATASGEKIGSLDTNPPTLATRIGAFPAEMDAIRHEIDAQEAAVKQTHAAMVAAEASVKQSTDALAAAKKLAEDRHTAYQAANAKLAEFQQKTEQARAKVTTHEAALQQHQGQMAALENEANPRRQAVETTTRVHAEATQALAAVEAEPDSPEKAAKLAAARASIDAAAQAMTQAQAALAEIDSRLAPVRDALKQQEAALAAARQDPILADPSGPALTQAVDATRIEWEKARDSVPAMEKAQTDAVAALEATKAPHQQALQARDLALGKVSHHQHQQRHWIRASWNAQAIALDHQAKALSQETDAAMDAFSQAAAEIGATLDQIAKLRADLEKPAEAPPTASPEDIEKEKARAADRAKELAGLLEKLDRQRDSLREIRAGIDARAPEQARMKQEAAALKARYRAASGV
jgi:hypothetical protein